MSADVKRREQLALYFGALFGAEPAGAFAEVRYKRPGGGMGQLWVPVEGPEPSFDSILRVGTDTDLYVGALPRVRRNGSGAAVERGHIAWADCDSPESIEALSTFTPAPSLIVGSGNGRHAYWPLWPPAGAEAIVRANRRLAHALGADMAATDAARILRPPGTFNHKSDPPRPVEVERVEVEVHALADVVGELPDPPAAPRDSWAPPKRPREDDALTAALRAVPPPVYVERLSGRQVGRDGKTRCPFHAAGQERTPSLHAYEDAAHGWTCFGGCEGQAGKRNGGDVFSFAAQLWRLEPAADFPAIRERLAAELLGEKVPA